jgi:hypothetical protein
MSSSHHQNSGQNNNMKMWHGQVFGNDSIKSKSDSGGN